MIQLKEKAVKAWSWAKKNKTFFVFLGLCLVPRVAFAWASPAAGDFAYDVYDIAVNRIAKGPVGFVVGSGLLAGSVFCATRSAWVPGIAMAVGSGIVYKVDTIAQSLGFVV